jgi:putative phage-type endonuclease
MNEPESESDSDEYETNSISSDYSWYVSESESESESESGSEYESDYETVSELSVSEISVSSDTESYQLENNTEDELLELEASVYENIDWYINEFSCNYSNPKFIENMIDDITQLIIIGSVETGMFDDEQDTNDSIRKFVEKRIEIYFQTGIVPPRSYPADYIAPPQSQEDQEKIKTQLTYLLNLPIQTQRTPEWYATRNRLMTASNIYKIFGSQCLYNSFILEKCKPLLVPIPNAEPCVNTESPMHWGVKYEPLSQRIYEILYSPKKSIAEFGCIIHPDYNCIGASPDGINIDTTSNHYGNMVEIKNIFNREITGVPSEMYWIQCQIQMEVCGLNICDFVETRFKEYENENAFWSEEGADEGGDEKQFRGVILYFVHKTALGSTPHYVYRIVDDDSYYKIKHRTRTDEWIKEQILELSDEYSLYKTIYWYLDQISVVVLPRNKLWFNCSIEKILDTWNVIEKERIEGFSHRLPQKKNKVKPPICVIKLE